LGPFGKTVAAFALAFFVALRFIPEFIDRGRLTYLALRSRGLSIDKLNDKIAFGLFMITPLFAGAIKKASSVAMALEIKGYGTRYVRAILAQSRPGFIDISILALSGGVILAGIIIK